MWRWLGCCGERTESDSVRVIEIFNERCELNDLKDRLKSLNEEKKAILTKACVWLSARFMGLDGCVEDHMMSIIREMKLSDEFIMATIKRLLDGKRDYWKHGIIDIYTVRKYKYIVMGKEYDSSDEAIDVILNTLSEDDRNIIIEDCITLLAHTRENFAKMLISSNFDYRTLIVEYFDTVERLERHDRSMGMNRIYVERVIE